MNHVHQVNQLCLRHVIEAHVHHGTQQPRLFRDEQYETNEPCAPQHASVRCALYVADSRPHTQNGQLLEQARQHRLRVH